MKWVLRLIFLWLLKMIVVGFNKRTVINKLHGQNSRTLESKIFPATLSSDLFTSPIIVWHVYNWLSTLQNNNPSDTAWEKWLLLIALNNPTCKQYDHSGLQVWHAYIEFQSARGLYLNPWWHGWQHVSEPIMFQGGQWGMSQKIMRVQGGWGGTIYIRMTSRVHNDNRRSSVPTL